MPLDSDKCNPTFYIEFSRFGIIARGSGFV